MRPLVYLVLMDGHWANGFGFSAPALTLTCAILMERMRHREDLLRVGDRYTLLAQGPVTLVRAFRATAAERLMAFPALRACRVLQRMISETQGGDRRDLIGVYELATGEQVLQASDILTCHFARRVLEAASDGQLLVVPGWCWQEGYAARARHEEEACPEIRVIQRVMKQEELAFEGTRYVLVPATSYARVSSDFEVVRREDASTLLRQMASRASSADERAAFTEAATLLADTKVIFPGKGLFLARRRIARGYDLAESEPITPSQLREHLSWVEIHLVGEDDSPVAGESYRLRLPNGQSVTGLTDSQGIVRVQGFAPGDCDLCFDSLDKDAWVAA